MAVKYQFTLGDGFGTALFLAGSPAELFDQCLVALADAIRCRRQVGRTAWRFGLSVVLESAENSPWATRTEKFLSGALLPDIAVTGEWLDEHAVELFATAVEYGCPIEVPAEEPVPF
jgi:hypothetical protein